MPRPKRTGWKPITMTVSEEAAYLLRVRAAELNTEMGTLATELIVVQLQAASGIKPHQKIRQAKARTQLKSLK